MCHKEEEMRHGEDGRCIEAAEFKGALLKARDRVSASSIMMLLSFT